MIHQLIRKVAPTFRVDGLYTNNPNLDLSRLSSPLVTHLCSFCFECQGAFVSQGRAFSAWIVEAVDVVDDFRFCYTACWPRLSPDYSIPYAQAYFLFHSLPCLMSVFARIISFLMSAIMTTFLISRVFTLHCIVHQPEKWAPLFGSVDGSYSPSTRKVGTAFRIS